MSFTDEEVAFFDKMFGFTSQDDNEEVLESDITEQSLRGFGCM
jgi:hypothetical protein